eukprot:SAG31_NODE_12063_length_972_cov_0.939290_2_plen_210_part_00
MPARSRASTSNAPRSPSPRKSRAGGVVSSKSLLPNRGDFVERQRTQDNLNLSEHNKRVQKKARVTPGDIAVAVLACAGGWHICSCHGMIAAALFSGPGAGDQPDTTSVVEQGFLVSAVLSYGFQIVNFMLSRLGVADNFTGLVEFLPAALLGLYRSANHQRQRLITVMLTIWSIRLGLFLLGRMFSRSGPVNDCIADRRASGHDSLYLC